MMAVAGFSTGGSGQNSGMGVVRLKDWSVRDADAASIGMRITGAMADKFRDAQIFAIAPSGIPGLGQRSGFSFQLQDLGGAGHEELVSAREQLLGLARSDEHTSELQSLMRISYAVFCLNNKI